MMIVGYDHNILGHFTAITKEPVILNSDNQDYQQQGGVL
jgi:hypothetical protein